MLPVVVHPAVRAGGVGPAAFQRAGGVERDSSGADCRDQYHGSEHRDDVRAIEEAGGQERSGPLTVVLDNARYQRNAVVQALATSLGIADFQAAIQDTLGQVSTKHKDKLASLMTRNFQVFDDVSLLAA